jgi:K+-sensing histidine kinase KdpD
MCGSDGGPGIPAALRGQVFERFWRGPWSRHVGSGLGLAIVREAGARIGAVVALEDAPSGGARVHCVSSPADRTPRARTGEACHSADAIGAWTQALL